MEFTITQWVLIFAAMLFGSTIQAAVGFASALVSIPLLLAAGLELPVAITMTLLSSTLQNVAGVFRLRSEIDFREARTPACLRLAFLPIGAALIFALGDIVSDQKVLLRQLFGALILIILCIQGVWRIEPRPKQHPAWMWLAFGSSGFLQGSIGVPGPSMVLWLMAHDWSPNKSRGLLFLMFLVCLPLHVAIFCLLWPNDFLQGLLLSALALPATGIGTFAGLIAGSRIPKGALRKITYTLLVIIAANLITMPLWMGSFE